MAEEIERISGESPRPQEALRQALQDLLPGAVTDGVLDAQRLADLLDVEIAGLAQRSERFGLNWAGKASAVKALRTPSMAALAPDLESSINWDTAENVFIEGDNLEVLKLLQKAYNDQVKLIYIDPPYNTGNDFVYNDSFSDSVQRHLEITGQIDAQGNRLVANAETAGRKHSNWLNMMHARLSLARNILSDDGLIMVSIDEHEVHNLLSLLNEIFGIENQIAIFHWKKRSTGGQVAKNAVIKQVEFILTYARNVTTVRLNQLPNPGVGVEGWRDFRKSGGQWQRHYRPNQHFTLWANPSTGEVSLNESAQFTVAVVPQDANGVDGFWENGQPTTALRIANGELRARDVNGRWKIEQKTLGNETVAVGTFIDIPSAQGGEDLKNHFGAVIFDNPKPVALMKRLIQIGADPDSLIMDFFGGSGTTAEAVLSLNSEDGGSRRFVLVNLNEATWEKSVARQMGFATVSEISRKRISSALMADESQVSSGLRCFAVADSAFQPDNNSETASLFHRNTLDQHASDDAIVSEVLIRCGVRLDHPWIRLSVSDTPAVESAGVAVLLARKATSELVAQAVLLSAHTVVFLEDAFADADDVKANAFFAFQRAGKTMRTM